MALQSEIPGWIFFPFEDDPFLFRNAERRKVATIARSSKPSLLYIYIYNHA